MKLIEAVIRRSKVDDVVQALMASGIQAMTLTDVRDAGHEHTYRETYRGIEHPSPYLPKVKFEVVVDDADASDVVDAVLSAAATGEPDDDRVLIIDVEVMIRVRTGERHGEYLASAAGE